MCSRKSGTGLKNIFVWSLVLLVFCSHTCWGDTVLTKEEVTLLKQSLRNADKALAEAQSELEKSNEKLATAEQKLQKAENTTAMLEKELKEQEQRLELLSTSLKEQKKEARKQKFWTGIKIVGAFVIGGAVGYTAGSIWK